MKTRPRAGKSLAIQVSGDGSTSITLGTYGNRAALTWEGVPADVRARYVRIVADNPNGDDRRGSIAEVEVWGLVPSQADPQARMPFLPARQQAARLVRSHVRNGLAVSRAGARR